MTQNVFIFHGTAGYPEENWFPWLKGKLEARGANVIVPAFPTPEGESLESWTKVLEKYSRFINEDTVMVGHSKGGLFLLRVLESLGKPIKAALFVAAPIGFKPILCIETDYAFSSGFEFNWKNIKQGARHFEVFHSDDDPYVDIKNGQHLAEELGVALNFIPNKGHFNAKAGVTEFPEIFEKIKPFLGK